MSIYDKIDKMSKEQAKAVARHAQARVEALDYEKKEALEVLKQSYYERSYVRFYGQDLLINGMFHYPCGESSLDSSERYDFEMNNGSKIIIRLD